MEDQKPPPWMWFAPWRWRWSDFDLLAYTVVIVSLLLLPYWLDAIGQLLQIAQQIIEFFE